MALRKQIWMLLLVMLFGSLANAQTDQPVGQVYFVSMLLKLESSQATVKQVHAIVTESSPDRAEEVFSATIRRDYPGYIVIDKLTSPASAITPPKCNKSTIGTSI